MQQISLYFNCLLFLFLIQGLVGQSGRPENIQSINKLLDKSNFSGSLLIAENGEILVEEGRGYQNREKGIENTPSTVFDTGSITKQFTAAAILKLEMQDKLSVTDPISMYFSNTPSQLEGLTLHELLTHTAGFPGAIGNDYDDISREDYIMQAFEANQYAAGNTDYEYSNVGYTLLALIIEDVSKMSYEEYLHSEIFMPADMRDTGYLLPDWDDDRVATGYDGDKSWGQPHKKWEPNGVSLHLKGNGGILSTVEDLYKWDQALLREDILSARARSKYFYPHAEEYKDGSSHYGYGWVILKTRRNTSLITHNGGNGIFFADFLRFVDDGTTIILMSNSSNNKTEELAWRIAAQWFQNSKKQ